MTEEKKTGSGSNLGCLLKFMGIIVAVNIIIFLLNTVKDWLIADDNGQALTLFHNDYFIFQKFYLTLPMGSLWARFLTGFIVTAIITGITYVIIALFQLKASDAVKNKRLSTVIPGIFWGLAFYFIFTGIFVPYNKIVLNKPDRQMEITEFKQVLYFFQTPIPQQKQIVPFDSIRWFKFTYYDDTFRGSKNYFLDMYCGLNNGDTLNIGHTMTHHGEFGIFDLRSQETRDSIARKKATAAVEALYELIE
ncbi:MAG: hypothetical protein KDC85_14520 [Saprospiraceae bacterium]|nr:hypothetical protein [Saprospiraceae bacterium]